MNEAGKIGYIGLGRMGFNMVTRLQENGVKVVGYDQSPEATNKISSIGGIPAKNVDDLVEKLDSPRIIWLMLPHGEPTEQTLKHLSKSLSKGDLIIDGGNSFYEDTIRRAEMLKASEIRFMDIAVSGGPSGARNGAALMIGGQEEDFNRVEWLAKIIAAPESYHHVGPEGAGHFVKMIHNGIEYGMMQSIGEGFAVLKKGPFDLDLAQVAETYRHNTVISSRLVDWLTQALKEDPELRDTSSEIKHTGEGAWTVQTAKELGVSVPAIETAFNTRVNSHNDPEDSAEGFRNKVISSLRGQFGQHDVRKEGKEGINEGFREINQREKL